MPKAAQYNLNGGRGNDTLDARTLNDTVEAGGVIISGNGGDDLLIGGIGKDVMKGGDGNDRMIASDTDLQGVSAGTLVYDGGQGSDTLDLSGIDAGTGIWLRMDNGAKGSNFIRTGVQFEQGTLDGGNISYTGSSFANNFKNVENFVLSEGDDVIQLLMPSGSNRILANGGNDNIIAGEGNDYIDGGSGNDMISGGWGSDTMVGGTGNDVFAITGRVVNEYVRDVIMDFDTKASSSDTSYDEIWLWPGWSVQWDSGDPTDVLHGFLYDNGTVWGELTLANLTLADADKVGLYNINLTTFKPDYGLV